MLLSSSPATQGHTEALAVPTWDQELIQRYNIHGPRYTSYPTALALSPDFSVNQATSALGESAQPLSLYIHIPFCHSLCYYCGCNKVITRHQHKADTYLDALIDEMKLYSPFVSHRKIQALHLGGGTPTFLSEAQFTRLFHALSEHFDFEPTQCDEVSIEIDPRECTLAKLSHIRELGFNRVSYGVQDFDQDVQIAINRIQDETLVRNLVDASRELGFDSINLDLVYGLPHQNLESFQHTLERVLTLNPDRISLFSYAHLPSRFPAQRKIKDHTLPNASDKLALLRAGIETFTGAGYQFIGMDHFARPDDELAIAQREGRLQRNFQGYTTHGSDCLLGLGVSSISQVNGVIWQHEKDVGDYQRMISEQALAVTKGISLTRDDQVRAALIMQLICHFSLDIASFEHRWQISFHDYFADAIEALSPFVTDKLVILTSQSIQVTPAGRLWVRSICSCFDAYLQQGQTRYSKVI
ncbi:oxygen-independent coproporphyrinogen III oxidase [Aliidiomarina halalkaliphila]|uniref:Coproporphyrinogen-III oxidase n=1 Tax=Aliidiomarina halalkaliphila TaxID=2593535 RepID=A0A552X1D6_9GAMM|nr:oxygen-independent coproporphyrinogen III oxidase [Aliidiomarina halalkaliphila]TRW48860.1 oxygen-independent coproporphyrinogen III oxidase [Aliidiomarina halalkaliphila]